MPSSDTTAIVALGTYGEVEIQARPSDQYINATAMCRAAGKRWAAYWQNAGTQEFIAALALELKSQNSDLCISVAGQYGGTWVHRRVALHLAQWCSPEFAVWVTGKIEELMLTGRTSIAREHAEADIARQFGEQVAASLMVIGEKVDACRAEVAEVRTEVLNMKGELHKRLPPRKSLGAQDQLMHREVARAAFQGLCPCCFVTQIVDQTTGDALAGLEYDHWESRSKPGPSDTWPVCETCNAKLGQPQSPDRQQFVAFFQTYQKRRELMYGGKGRMVRGTKQDVPGQQLMY